MWLQVIFLTGLISLSRGYITEVITESGKIIGKELKTRELPVLNGNLPPSTTYVAYRGIPYGKVPFRFRDAVPVPSWTTPLNADADGSPCVQPDGSGSEDCLFLNIYVPVSCDLPWTLYPVDVYLPGGGFNRNSNNFDQYGPDFLIKKCVIIITVNSRLGPLGFLSTGDCNAPGNAGLKDLVLALKWIKRNINYFHGDDQSITISGQSSGGASAHLLTLSPSANGLFRHAIVQSATAIAPWATVPPEKAKTAAFALGAAFNISTTDNAELVLGLSNIAAGDLCKASMQFVIFDFITPFLPTWETPSASYSTFITKPPIEIIKNGEYNRDTSLTIGYNSGEGILFGLGLLSNPPAIPLAVDYVERYILPGMLNTDPSKIDALVTTLNQRYFPGQPPSIQNFQNVVDFVTDTLFKCPIIKTLEIQQQYQDQKLYLYQFSFYGKYNFYSQYVNQVLASQTLPVVTGASHEDEVDYIIRRTNVFPGQTDYPPTTYDSPERTMVDKMTTAWASIVKNVQISADDNIPLGLSSTPWNPFTTLQYNYLDINNVWTIKTGKDPACVDLDRMAVTFA